MKKITQLPFILAIAGIFILLIAFFSGWMEWPALISPALFLLGLLGKGTVLILVNPPKGFLPWLAIYSAGFGFLIWILAVFGILELKLYWNIGFGLLSAGLILAIYSRLSIEKPIFKWISLFLVACLLVVEVCTLFKAENALIYALGSLTLICFSVLALLNTLKARP